MSGCWKEHGRVREQWGNVSLWAVRFPCGGPWNRGRGEDVPGREKGFSEGLQVGKSLIFWREQCVFGCSDRVSGVSGGERARACAQPAGAVLGWALGKRLSSFGPHWPSKCHHSW